LTVDFQRWEKYMVVNCDLCHQPCVLLSKVSINANMAEHKYHCENCDDYFFILVDKKQN